MTGATGMVDEAVSGPPGFRCSVITTRAAGRPISSSGECVASLEEFGADLAHSVRLDQYYPNPRAVAAYHLARHDEFGDYIPPSTSVVMERCFGGGRQYRRR